MQIPARRGSAPIIGWIQQWLRSGRRPGRSGIRPDDAAAHDLAAVHEPGCHGAVASLEQNVRMIVSIEVASPDRLPVCAGIEGDKRGANKLRPVHLPDVYRAIGIL